MARSAKKAVNLSISTDLLQAARDDGINLSAALEAAIGTQLCHLRAQEWLKQNREEIQAYNLDVEEHGTFSDGLRAF